MIKNNWIFTGLMVLAAAGLGGAHLGPITTPKAGDVVKAGDMVTVKWTVPESHSTMDVSLSTDGKTWTKLNMTALPSNTSSFNWTVPNQSSATARLRICQRQSAATCTDAQNSTGTGSGGGVQVTGGTVYVQVTQNFTMQSGTEIVPLPTSLKAPELIFNPATNNLDVAFALAHSGKVVLQAFDSHGRLVATLMDEVRSEGAQHASLFSTSLGASSSPLLFKLKIGDQVYSQMAPGIR